MAQTTESSATAGAPATAAGGAVSAPLTPEQVRESIAGKFVCPFCGSVNEADQGVCPRCTMENSAASRKATKTRIGPWYVLQTRNPAAPGMKFDTLLSFVRKGRVKARSIVRGPTTHQLWRFAAHVKGLSREFSVCYSCGGGITQATNICPQCNRLQDPPANPDALLETSKEASTPPSAPNAVAAPPDTPAPHAGAPGSPAPRTKVQEPSLESADADFVVPALSNSTDSMAGFSLNADSSSGSVAGAAVDPSWSRIEPRNGNGGASYGAGTPRGGAARTSGPGSTRPAPPPNPNRRALREGEGFLSAKDLAAAFQLDFKPEAAGTPAPRPSYTPPSNSTAFDDTEAMFAPPRPRRRVLKAVLLITVLATACAGVALWLDDDLRHQVLGQWLGLTQFADSPDPKASARPPAGANASRASKPAPGRPSTTAPSADPSRDAAMASAKGGWATQTQPNSPSVSAKPSNSTRGSSTQPARGKNTAAEVTSATESVRLYREGMEAERRADWAGASSKYHQVMSSFPEADWPGDLKSRATFADSQLKRN